MTDEIPIQLSHTLPKLRPFQVQSASPPLSNLIPLPTSASIEIWKICTGFNTSRGPTLTNGTILSFGRMYAWIYTVVQTLTIEITCGVTIQKYDRPFRVNDPPSHKSDFWYRLSCRILRIESLENYVFQIKFPTFTHRAKIRRPKDGQRCNYFQYTFTKKIYITVNRIGWFQYIGTHFGCVHGFFIVEFDPGYLQVTPLGSDEQARCLSLLPTGHNTSLDYGIYSFSRYTLVL